MRNKIRILSIFLLATLLLVACSPNKGVNEEANVGTDMVPAIKKEAMIDLSKMTAKAVFMDVALERNNAMRGFGVDSKNQEFYISQTYYNLPSDLMINKVELQDEAWVATEWMHAYESGYGGLSVEKDANGNIGLWMESNGTLEDIGTTISYVNWENEGFIQREYGQTFRFDSSEGSYLSPQIDKENDWLVLRVTDKNGSRYDFYDKSSLLDGEEPKCIYSVTCKAGQKATAGKDDSKGRYGTVTLRGFTVGGGYIYQLHGNAQGKIFVAVFDLEGNLAYCHMVKEYGDLAYRAPEALAYEDGKLYLLLTTGESGDRLASVLAFE